MSISLYEFSIYLNQILDNIGLNKLLLVGFAHLNLDSKYANEKSYYLIYKLFVSREVLLWFNMTIRNYTRLDRVR